jgi:hypothetical protein
MPQAGALAFPSNGRNHVHTERDRDRAEWLTDIEADRRLSEIDRRLAREFHQLTAETPTTAPGVDALIEAVGASRRSVLASTARLRELGYLLRVEQARPRRGSTRASSFAEYRLCRPL